MRRCLLQKIKSFPIIIINNYHYRKLLMSFNAKKVSKKQFEDIARCLILRIQFFVVSAATTSFLINFR